MLTGKELGAAIKAAIEKKGVTQKAVAAHFSIKPPSVQDWIKKGTIGKDKLPELWAYFADVVGPDHWGLQQFPQGSFPTSTTIKATDLHVDARIPLRRRQISDSQWALLEDFEMLPDDEKQALRGTLKAKADHVRKIVADYLGRKGVTGTVSDERVAESFGSPPPSPPNAFQYVKKNTTAPKNKQAAKKVS